MKMKLLKDGKKVVFKSNKNLPKMSWINKIYSKLPDDPKIPISFQTKKQYLNSYIKNQELKHGIDFSRSEEREYMKRELANMKGVTSRYTTKSNPYAKPMTVFFTDNPMTKKQFCASARHEVGHEIFERNKPVASKWRMSTNHINSPTAYGRTDAEEDFAESYSMFRNGDKVSKNRKSVLVDISSKNNIIPAFRDIDYVAKGIKPIAMVSVTKMDPKYEKIATDYANSWGLKTTVEEGRYGPSNQFEYRRLIIRKPSTYYDENKTFEDQQKKVGGAGALLGYPKKASDAWESKFKTQDGVDANQVRRDFISKGISPEDYEYLEFVPLNMSLNEVKSEIAKRKQVIEHTKYLKNKS